jgi:bacteriocin-like protein
MTSFNTVSKIEQFQELSASEMAAVEGGNVLAKIFAPLIELADRIYQYSRITHELR